MAVELWRSVWRDWVVTSPLLTKPSFKHLLDALVRDDDRLTRQTSVYPVCCTAMSKAKCERACPLCLMLWYESELDTARQVEVAFSLFLEDVDARSASKFTITPLLDFIDERPWDEVRRELILEIQRQLAEETANVR